MLLGAIAGIVGTAAMTAAMRVLHRRLKPAERYPLPPREIIDQLLPEPAPEQVRQTSTITSHFGYGAGMGALFALAPMPKGPLVGAAYGRQLSRMDPVGKNPQERRSASAPTQRVNEHGPSSMGHRNGADVSRAQARAGRDFSQGEPRDAPSAASADEAQSGSQSPRSCSTV
jgi:hypothetical protein